MDSAVQVEEDFLLLANQQRDSPGNLDMDAVFEIMNSFFMKCIQRVEELETELRFCDV
jgi:hypothetical protein